MNYSSKLSNDRRTNYFFLSQSYFTFFSTNQYIYIRCYEYYLEKVDPRDTSILTRLGNLLVKENNQAAAVDVYQKVLDIDDTLHNVWFNKGNAQMHIGDMDGE